MVEHSALAGPSSKPAGVPSSRGNIGPNKAFVSFREIYDHLELARHQRSPEELEEILRYNKARLQRCARPYAKSNDAAKAKIRADTVTLDTGVTVKLDEQQRELCTRIADRYDLDEVEALVLLRTFLESEDRSLDLLTRPTTATSGGSGSGSVSRASVAPGTTAASSSSNTSAKGKAGKAGSDDLVSDFLDAFNVFYFEERLYLLRSTCSLFRIGEDPSHELYDLACDVLALFADEAFGLACLDDFEALVAEPLVDHVREQPRYAGFWAKQKLKEQIGLLEVVFLLLYGRIQASPSLIVRILATLQSTDAGRQQANVGFFDSESIELVGCIGHLLVLIGVESLALEEAMDGIDLDGTGGGNAAAGAHSQNRLVVEPERLGEALDLLEQTGQDPSRSPVLLAWALVLNRIDAALATAEEQLLEEAGDGQPRLPAKLAAIADALRTDDGGPPVCQRLAHAAFAPELGLFSTMGSILSSPLLAASNSTAAVAVSAPSALAYRAVFKGLLLSITELVKPEFLPNFDALVSLWEAAFGSGVAVELSQSALEGVAALCVQFWEVDSHYDSRCATIDTARRRWPVSFRPLTRLIKALTGNAKPDALGSWPSSLSVGARTSSVEQACTSAFQFLAQVPTFAQVLTQGGAAIGAPYETIDGGDYVSVNYRVSRTHQVAGTHVRLPAGTTGSAISEIGATPVIVLWTPPAPISAWKLMRDVLVGFPPDLSTSMQAGHDDRVFDDDNESAVADFTKLAPANADDPWEEVAAEALELFSSVISASPKLAWALLSHLDGDDSALLGDAAMDLAHGPDAHAQRLQQRGRSKDLAAISIHLLRHALVDPAIHTRLIDAAYKLLSMLLPYMPNEIWQTVRSLHVLTGSPGVLSYVSSHRSVAGVGVPSASAIEGLFGGSTSAPSVLLAHETARASYGGLLSLLDFLTALVLEMQRSHFVCATEALENKASVLARSLAWVFEAVWPEYQSWRYGKLRDKLEIGRRCTTLFHLVLSETSWKVASLPNADGREQRGPASGLVEAVERAFVASPSMLALAPLVGALGSGQQLIDQLHRAGRQADAALAEDYVLASLRLARLIVSRRRDLLAAHLAAAAALRQQHSGKASSAIRVELGLMERLFFDHTAVAMRSVSGGGRKSARVEQASAIMSYILLPISSEVSAEAAKLVTAICRSTADVAACGQPVPGMVGHLGTLSELESTIAGLVDLVGNSYLDASLRADVWNMLGAIVDTQPALATLLLTGRHLAKTTEHQLNEPSAGEKAGLSASVNAAPTVSSSYGQALSRTALEVASDAVMIGVELLRSDPALLESILRFLDTAWAHASEHVAAFEPVRSRATFFKALGDLATAEADSPPAAPEGFVFEDGARRTDSDVDCREYSHRRMCQARALRLLEQDAQLGGKTTSASLDTLLALLVDGPRLRSALEACFRTHCDPALQYEAERRLAETFPTVNLSSLPHPPKRDDFDSSRQYGDEYVYDAAALRRKLEGFYDTLGEDDVDDLEALEEGVLTVATINLEWSALDVQATSIRAWTQTIRSGMGRLVTAATTSKRLDKLEQALIAAWTACATMAADEALEGDVMRGIHAARIELLSVIMEAAWGRRDTNAKGEQIVEVSELASRLLGHTTYSVEDSIQGLVAPPFHRGCFDIALFCAVQCRSWLKKRQSTEGASASATATANGNGEAHRALHRVMDAFARHTITSLRLAMGNCLLCIQQGMASSDSARALEDDLDLLVSLFELVIRDDVGLLPHSWLTQVQSDGLFQASIDLLSRAPVVRLDASRDAAGAPPSPNSAHHPVFVTPVLSLLLALSSQPASSEQLALAGVVNGLASNMLSEPLEAGAILPLLLSGDRNPTHEAWSTMLRIVVNLIDNLGAPSQPVTTVHADAPSPSSSAGSGGVRQQQTVQSHHGSNQWAGASARFIETDVDGFVRVYLRQIDNALAFAPIYALDSSISAASVGGFGASLAASVHGGLGHRQQHDNGSGLASVLTVAGLEEVELIARLVYAMLRSEAAASPSSSSAAVAGGRTALSHHLLVRLTWLLQPLVHLLQHPRELQSLLGLADDDNAAAAASRANKLLDNVQRQLRRTAAVIVSALWFGSQTTVVLCRETQAWPFPVPSSHPAHGAVGAGLVKPVMRTHPISSTSLGTLLDLASLLTDLLRSPRGTGDGDGDGEQEALRDALEQTLAVCASQAALWALAPPLTSSVSQQTGARRTAKEEQHADYAAKRDSARQEIQAGLARELATAIRSASDVVSSSATAKSAGAGAGKQEQGARTSILPVVLRLVEGRLDSRLF